MMQFDPIKHAAPEDGGSLFMRPFAFALTAYLVTYSILHMLAHGRFRSPDMVSDVYLFVMATYAGAPEIKRWSRLQARDPEGWAERIRKGGPIVTLWFVLWFGAVLWRIYDSSVPMPQELKSILIQMMTLFFGAYAVRQMRKGAVTRRVGRAGTDISDGEEPEGDTAEAASQVLEHLQANGPTTPKALREALGLSRSTVTRSLSELLRQAKVRRDSTSPRDPNPLYQVN